MHLLLAIVCLGGAAAIFYQQATSDASRWYILGSKISMGWFLLLLAVYNLARWYSARAGREEQRAARLVEEARQRQARQREHHPREYNPAFDFSNNPPPPPDPNPPPPPAAGPGA